MYGVSNIVPDADGWSKVQPQDGPALLVKPLAAPGQNAPAMSLKLGGASYNCRRLPLSV